MSPESPPNEEARIEALHALDILDTGPEDSFDRLTRLAADIFQVPIALVSLIDSRRQWFKSCIGLDVNETGREISFCGHAILNQEPLIIPDTLKDPRFAGNPLVTGPPRIRFYAGAPLDLGGGRRIGTLCIIDTRPHDFSERHQGILKLLAEQTLDAIRLREHIRAAERHQASLEVLLQSSPMAMLVHEGERIVFANRAAARLLGKGPAAELLGKSVLDFAANEKVQRAFAGVMRRQKSGLDSPAGDIEISGATLLVVEAQSRNVQFAGKPMILTSFQDVTSARVSQKALLERADTDSLTGLRRRQVFDELMAAYAKDEREPAYSLALFDVDHFKSVNDRFGHVAGDQVLKRIAGAIASLTRKSDTAVRWGGEELAVLLRDCKVDQAFDFAERVRKEVEALADLPCPVTLSAGVSTQIPGETSDKLILRADEALYLAKSSGRNQVQRSN